MDINDILKQERNRLNKENNIISFDNKVNDIVSEQARDAILSHPTYITTVDDQIKELNRLGITYSPGMNVQELLAKNQSLAEKWGNGLSRGLVSEIILATPLAFSTIIDFLAWKATGKKDFVQNPVTQLLQEWQDDFDNSHQIYVDPTLQQHSQRFIDGSWWASNIPSIATGLSMMLPSGLIGKVATKGVAPFVKILANATKYTGNAVKSTGKVVHALSTGSAKGFKASYAAEKALWKPISKTTANGLESLTQMGITAFTGRVIENYQEASQVNNDMYSYGSEYLNKLKNQDSNGDGISDYDDYINKNRQKLIEAGVDINNPNAVAKYIANESAKQTFSIDWWNIGFDILELYTLKGLFKNAPFKGKATTSTKRQLQNEFDRFAALNAGQEYKRTFGKQIGNFIKDNTKRVGKGLLGAGSEGLEEVVNYIAQQEGMTYGKALLSGYDEYDAGLWNHLNNYTNDTELYDSMFWGFMGGLAFQGGGAILGTFKERRHNKKVTQAYKDLKNWEYQGLTDSKAQQAVLDNTVKQHIALVTQINEIQNNEKFSDEDKKLMIDNAVQMHVANRTISHSNTGTIDLLEEFINNKDVQEYFAKNSNLTQEEINEITQQYKQTIESTKKNYKEELAKVTATVNDFKGFTKKEGKFSNWWSRMTSSQEIPTEMIQAIASQNARNKVLSNLSEEQLKQLANSITQLQQEYDAEGNNDDINFQNLLDTLNTFNYRQVISDLYDKLFSIKGDSPTDIQERENIKRQIHAYENKFNSGIKAIPIFMNSLVDVMTNINGKFKSKLTEEEKQAIQDLRLFTSGLSNKSFDELISKEEFGKLYDILPKTLKDVIDNIKYNNEYDFSEINEEYHNYERTNDDLEKLKNHSVWKEKFDKIKNAYLQAHVNKSGFDANILNSDKDIWNAVAADYYRLNKAFKQSIDNAIKVFTDVYDKGGWHKLNYVLSRIANYESKSWANQIQDNKRNGDYMAENNLAYGKYNVLKFYELTDEQKADIRDALTILDLANNNNYKLFDFIKSIILQHQVAKQIVEEVKNDTATGDDPIDNSNTLKLDENKPIYVTYKDGKFGKPTNDELVGNDVFVLIPDPVIEGNYKVQPPSDNYYMSHLNDENLFEGADKFNTSLNNISIKTEPQLDVYKNRETNEYEIVVDVKGTFTAETQDGRTIDTTPNRNNPDFDENFIDTTPPGNNDPNAAEDKKDVLDKVQNKCTTYINENKEELKEKSIEDFKDILLQEIQSITQDSELTDKISAIIIEEYDALQDGGYDYKENEDDDFANISEITDGFIAQTITLHNASLDETSPLFEKIQKRLNDIVLKEQLTKNVRRLLTTILKSDTFKKEFKIYKEKVDKGLDTEHTNVYFNSIDLLNIINKLNTDKISDYKGRYLYDCIIEFINSNANLNHKTRFILTDNPTKETALKRSVMSYDDRIKEYEKELTNETTFRINLDSNIYANQDFTKSATKVLDNLKVDDKLTYSIETDNKGVKRIIFKRNNVAIGNLVVPTIDTRRTSTGIEKSIFVPLAGINVKIVSNQDKFTCELCDLFIDIAKSANDETNTKNKLLCNALYSYCYDPTSDKTKILNNICGIFNNELNEDNCNEALLNILRKTNTDINEASVTDLFKLLSNIWRYNDFSQSNDIGKEYSIRLYFNKVEQSARQVVELVNNNPTGKVTVTATNNGEIIRSTQKNGTTATYGENFKKPSECLIDNGELKVNPKKVSICICNTTNEVTFTNGARLQAPGFVQGQTLVAIQRTDGSFDYVHTVGTSLNELSKSSKAYKVLSKIYKGKNSLLHQYLNAYVKACLDENLDHNKHFGDIKYLFDALYRNRDSNEHRYAHIFKLLNGLTYNYNDESKISFYYRDGEGNTKPELNIYNNDGKPIFVIGNEKISLIKDNKLNEEAFNRLVKYIDKHSKFDLNFKLVKENNTPGETNYASAANFKFNSKGERKFVLRFTNLLTGEENYINEEFNDYNSFVLTNDLIKLNLDYDLNRMSNYNIHGQRKQINNAYVKVKPIKATKKTKTTKKTSKTSSPVERNAGEQQDNLNNALYNNLISLDKLYTINPEIIDNIIIQLAGNNTEINQVLKTLKDLHLLNKSIIFDANDEKVNGDNASYAYFSHLSNQIVVGKKWLNLMNSNPYDAIRYLLHENLHDLVNSLSIEQKEQFYNAAKDCLDKARIFYEKGEDTEENKYIKSVLKRYLSLEETKAANENKLAEEFVVYALTSRTLQNALNNIVITNHETIWTKIKKALNDLYKALVNGFVDIKEGSLLEYTFDNISSIFEQEVKEFSDETISDKDKHEQHWHKAEDDISEEDEASISEENINNIDNNFIIDDNSVSFNDALQSVPLSERAKMAHNVNNGEIKYICQ